MKGDTWMYVLIPSLMLSRIPTSARASPNWESYYLTLQSHKWLKMCNYKFLKIIFRPPERPPKIAKPTVFHVVNAGYWGKFSISNNHASVEPHWLWYCHCAKLIRQCLVCLFYIKWCSHPLVGYNDVVFKNTKKWVWPNNVQVLVYCNWLHDFCRAYSWYCWFLTSHLYV